MSGYYNFANVVNVTVQVSIKNEFFFLKLYKNLKIWNVLDFVSCRKRKLKFKNQYKQTRLSLIKLMHVFIDLSLMFLREISEPAFR